MSDVGVVQSLLRFPVKSMGGEVLERVEALPERGFVGDRGWAVIDSETGHVASAKHPKKWGALLECHARLAGEAASVVLPDGSEVQSNDPAIHARLSTLLGRDVTLTTERPRRASYEEVKGEAKAAENPLGVAAAPDTFFDFAPIHLLTTASLARLAELAPESTFAVTRFRPNLVVETDEASGFLEDDWVGRIVAIGDHVRLLVVSTCPRCAMTTLAQGSLPSDPAVLRTIAQNNVRTFELLARKLPSVGVYATVLMGGEIVTGDPVRLEGYERLRRAGVLARAAKRAVVG